MGPAAKRAHEPVAGRADATRQSQGPRVVIPKLTVPLCKVAPEADRWGPKGVRVARQKGGGGGICKNAIATVFLLAVSDETVGGKSRRGGARTRDAVRTRRRR